MSSAIRLDQMAPLWASVAELETHYPPSEAADTEGVQRYVRYATKATVGDQCEVD